MKPISPLIRNLFILLTFAAIGIHTAFVLNLLVKQAELQVEVVTLKKALAEAEQAQVEQGILKGKEVCIPGSGYRKPIPFQEIVYVEAFNGQTIFYLTRKRQLSCEYGLDKVQKELLNNEDFCRIHRTYLINKPYYKYYTPREAKREGFQDPGKWGIVVNKEYGQLKLSESGRNRCYPKGRNGDYCY